MHTTIHNKTFSEIWDFWYILLKRGILGDIKNIIQKEVYFNLPKSFKELFIWAWVVDSGAEYKQQYQSLRIDWLLLEERVEWEKRKDWIGCWVYNNGKIILHKWKTWIQFANSWVLVNLYNTVNDK